MARLATYTNKKKWRDIATEHSGKQPRYTFAEINEDPANNLKVVIRGMYTPRGSDTDQVSNTGFLENETGEIVAGVDSIPREAEDTEPNRD